MTLSTKRLHRRIIEAQGIFWDGSPHQALEVVDWINALQPESQAEYWDSFRVPLIEFYSCRKALTCAYPGEWVVYDGIKMTPYDPADLSVAYEIDDPEVDGQLSLPGL